MSGGIIVLVVFASFILLMLISLLIGSYITYRMTFYQSKKKRYVDPYRHIKDDGEPKSLFSRKLIDNILEVPYENIYVISHDGLRLRARLYMKGKDLPFVIEAHGYKSSPMIDFAGGGVLMMELGFNVIMIDERACGESEGTTISFGFNESRDLLAWIEYIRENYGEQRKIILQGMSLGAATVLMASGLKLPSSVIGIMADCPYSSAPDIIKKVISEDMKLPVSICYPLVKLGAKLYGRFNLKDADAAEAVKKSSVPILIIHGEADSFVPGLMSEKIAKSNGNIRRETFPDADHGLSFIYDYERYKMLVVEFIENSFKEAAK